MKKKITFEQAESLFSERGYILLDKEYVNSNTKMKYKCPNHPNEVLEITYSKLKEGSGCRYCANERRAKNQTKYTLEELREMFSNRGYTLLNNKFVSSKKLLYYTCPKHPDKTNKILLSNFKKNQGCSHCAIEARTEKQKHSFEYVYEKFNELGYTLLENHYVNGKTPMKFKCDKHPNKELKIAFSDLLKGQGCKYCGHERLAENKRLSFEFIKEEFTKRGYELLEENYHGNLQKLKYICPKHPDKENSITYLSLSVGSGCKYCANENISGENNHLWKGGVSELNNYLRQKLSDWKIKSFEKYDYTCFVSGIRGTYLEVHHIKPFNIIRDETLQELNLSLCKYISDYSRLEIDNISKIFLEKHYENLGVPLTKEVHKLFHDLYGWDEDVNFQDLINFKEKYNTKEFLINN